MRQEIRHLVTASFLLIGALYFAEAITVWLTTGGNKIADAFALAFGISAIPVLLICLALCAYIWRKEKVPFHLTVIVYVIIMILGGMASSSVLGNLFTVILGVLISVLCIGSIVILFLNTFRESNKTAETAAVAETEETAATVETE